MCGRDQGGRRVRRARIPESLQGGRVINALRHNFFAETSQLIHDAAHDHFNVNPADATSYPSDVPDYLSGIDRGIEGMRIGIVATRLFGVDGVTFEAAKWEHVLERMGHEVRVAPDGMVTVIVDKSEMGQGIETSIAMLVAEDLGVGQASGVINCHMKAVVACTSAGVAPITCDAMANPLEAGELLDVQVDQLARVLTLIAPRRLLWLQGRQATQPSPGAPGGRPKALIFSDSGRTTTSGIGSSLRPSSISSR